MRADGCCSQCFQHSRAPEHVVSYVVLPGVVQMTNNVGNFLCTFSYCLHIFFSEVLKILCPVCSCVVFLCWWAKSVLNIFCVQTVLIFLSDIWFVKLFPVCSFSFCFLNGVFFSKPNLSVYPTFFNRLCFWYWCYSYKIFALLKSQRVSSGNLVILPIRFISMIHIEVLFMFNAR